MDTVNFQQIIVAVFLLARLVFVQATVMFDHPNDVAVEPNVWANFSCTVHCRFKVEWYKVGHSYPIKNYTDSRSIDRLKFDIPPNSTCTSEFRTTHFLEVLATREFHNSAFYCAAYENCESCPQTECKCGCVGRCFSRPAFLTVERVATSTTSYPTPSPSHPSQETVPHEVTTKTVTITATVTPTNCPTSAAVAGLTPLQLLKSSSQAASAQTTFLAGMGIAASSLFLL